MQVPASLAYAEIHHWPHDGRLLLINKKPQWDHPVLTWLLVTAADGVTSDDATVAVAYALGSAAALEGEPVSVVLHDRHGNMLGTPGGLGLPAVALRRVTGR